MFPAEGFFLGCGMRKERRKLETVSKPRAGVACVWRWLAASLLLPVFSVQYWSSSLLASRRQPRRTASREVLKQLLAKLSVSWEGWGSAEGERIADCPFPIADWKTGDCCHGWGP